MEDNNQKLILKQEYTKDSNIINNHFVDINLNMNRHNLYKLVSIIISSILIGLFMVIFFLSTWFLIFYVLAKFTSISAYTTFSIGFGLTFTIVILSLIYLLNQSEDIFSSISRNIHIKLYNFLMYSK